MLYWLGLTHPCHKTSGKLKAFRKVSHEWLPKPYTNSVTLAHLNTMRRSSTKPSSTPALSNWDSAYSGAASGHLCEVDVTPGLELLAYDELCQQLGAKLTLTSALETQAQTGALQFRYQGGLVHLLRLKTVLTAYLVCHVDGARPSALLGHQNFQQLLQHIQLVRAISLTTSPALSPTAFRTFSLSAAGAESTVMTRLADLLRQTLALPLDVDNADLLLRIRRPHFGQPGWQVLIRLSPRPLSVRQWRVSDMKGALNAAVAACMVRLTQPTGQDRFLNLCCGSGTLLIERLLQGPANSVIGCDIDPAALTHARANLQASGLQQRIALHQWDARTLALPERSIDALCADLPFGIAVGVHEENVALYPLLLQEAARVAKAGARFVVLTQEVRLLEGLLAGSNQWSLLQSYYPTIRGLRPRLYVLQRQ